VGGEELADRAIVVVVERAVVVAGVLGVGRRLTGGGMLVVVVVTAAVFMVVAGSGRSVVFKAVGVAVVMSADSVQAGVPQERNRAVGHDEAADGGFAEEKGHGEKYGPANGRLHQEPGLMLL
jgi:hypothetical protein